MGSLLRLLLSVAGWRVFERTHLTPVSKTIDMLPARKSARWLWGGVVHFTPAVIGLAMLFSQRQGEVTHGTGRIAVLLIAVLWAFVGPALIWSYERYTLALLNKRCREHLADREQRRTIQKEIFSPVLDTGSARLIVALWMGGVVYAFFHSFEFVRGFGIRGYTDWYWWAFLTGVLFLSFYCALGFCLAYKSVRLVRLISRAEIRHGLYHEDRVLGLSFVVDFALRTNLMFASGWLFVPLLLMGVPSQQVWMRDNRVVLIVCYALFGLLSFLAPVYLVHAQIRRIKRQLLQLFGTRASCSLERLSGGYHPDVAGEFETCRSAISDTQSIHNWPLSLDALIRVSMSTMLIPIVVGLVLMWLDRPKS